MLDVVVKGPCRLTSNMAMKMIAKKINCLVIKKHKTNYKIAKRQGKNTFSSLLLSSFFISLVLLSSQFSCISQLSFDSLSSSFLACISKLFCKLLWFQYDFVFVGTLYSQANTTRDLQTGIQVWLGIGIQLISGLTETLLVRTVIRHTYKPVCTWLTHKVTIMPFLPSIFLRGFSLKIRAWFHHDQLFAGD